MQMNRAIVSKSIVIKVDQKFEIIHPPASQFKIFLLITSYIIFSESPAPLKKGAKKIKEDDDHESADDKENEEDSVKEEPDDDFKPNKCPQEQSLKTTPKP